MVSFTCGYCQDVVKKPKVVSHHNSCGSDHFTCVDCMKSFDLNTIKNHTSCISETEKYQGKWRPTTTTTRRVADSDSDGEGNRPAPLRPPRPAMNFSDDSDDDEWVRGSSTTSKAKAAKQTKRSATPPSISSTAAAGARKRDREESGSRRATPKSAATEVNGSSKTTKMAKLVLPRSTNSDECAVPLFLLGSAGEIAAVTGDVLEEFGGPISVKALSKELVSRYAVRIAKALRPAIHAAVEAGALAQDVNGNISLQ